MFGQEYSLDKNISLDCQKTCERSEQKQANEVNSVASADAFGDTHINAFGDTHVNAFGDTHINAFGDTHINAFGVWEGATLDTHINAFGA